METSFENKQYPHQSSRPLHSHSQRPTHLQSSQSRLIPEKEYGGHPDLSRDSFSRDNFSDLRKQRPIPVTKARDYPPQRDQESNQNQEFRSSEDLGQQKVDQRHDELRKLIAMKEQQLADLTRERSNKQEKLKSNSSSSPFRKSNQEYQDPNRGSQGNKPPSVRDSQSSRSPMGGRQYPQNQIGGVNQSNRGQQSQNEGQEAYSRVESSSRGFSQELHFRPIRETRVNTSQINQPSAGNSVQKYSPLRDRSKSGENARILTRPEPGQSLFEQKYNQFKRETSGSKGRSLAEYLQADPILAIKSDRLSPQIVMSSESPYKRDTKSRSPTKEVGSNRFTETDRVKVYQQPVQYSQPKHFGNRPASFGQGDESSQGSRQYTISSPQRQKLDVSRFMGPNARELLYKDRIEAMSIDNQHLQRRLTSVGGELDRIRAERDGLQRQMRLLEGENNRLDRQINERDEVDMQNQTMRDEVEKTKMDNDRLEKRIGDEKIASQSVNDQVVRTNAERKNGEFQVDDINSNLQKKLRMIDQISRDRSRVLQDIHQIGLELESMVKRDQTISRENGDLDRFIQQLQSEKQELQRSVEGLKKQLDECMRDLSWERRNVERQNLWNTNLVSAKITLETLSAIQTRRLSNALFEIKAYSEFDKDCSTKLKQLGLQLVKLGQFKLKLSLNKWYDRTLKPCKIRQQNQDVALLLKCNNLQAKVFYAWQQYHRDKMDRYIFKTNSIQSIWFILAKNAKTETMRALQIWRGATLHNQESHRRLKKLILRRKERLFQEALSRWKIETIEIEQQCRRRLLQVQFSRKLLMSQVFRRMREVLLIEKRQRLRTLRVMIKGWREYVDYNRHLMLTNMAAINFSSVNREYLLKAVFDALRVNKESSKHLLLTQALEEDMNIAIVNTQQSLEKRTDFTLRKAQIKGGDAIISLLAKRLFSYFLKWKKVSQSYKYSLKTVLKGRVLKLYLGLIQTYFTRWRSQLDSKSRQIKVKAVASLITKRDQVMEDAMEGHKLLKGKAQGDKNDKKKILEKTVDSCYLRRLERAISRWRDEVTMKRNREERIVRLVMKRRNRLLRDAMDRYKDHDMKERVRLRNEKTIEYLLDQRSRERVRTTFNALFYYAQKMRKARRVWSVIFTRVDFFMRCRAVRRWSYNCQLKQESNLHKTQSSIIDSNLGLCANINELEASANSQENEIQKQRKDHEHRCTRVIGIFFQNFYYRQMTLALRKWRVRCDIRYQKQQLTIRQIRHKNTILADQATHLLKKFKCDDFEREALESIQQKVFEQNALITKIQDNKNKMNQLRVQQLGLGSVDQQNAERMDNQYRELMVVLERRNREWERASKKRMIFLWWKHYFRQQKAFSLAIKNSLEKSMFKDGLTRISQFAQDVKTQRRKERLLRKYITSNQYFRLTDAINKWRQSSLAQVGVKHSEVIQSLNHHDSRFEDLRQKAKDVNVERCLEYFQDLHKRNVMKAWLNSIDKMRMLRVKSEMMREKCEVLRKRFTLGKLKLKTDKTKHQRALCQRADHWRRFHYFKAAFKAMKNRYKTTKRYASSVHTLERVLGDKLLMDGFTVLKSYLRSKGEVFQFRKKQASSDIFKWILRSLYLKMMKNDFSALKLNSEITNADKTIVKTVFGRAGNRRLRDAFEQWRRRDQLIQLAQEQYETGPVRAEKWDADREIGNLMEFMRKEGYSEKQIEDMVKGVDQKNRELLDKYVRRMKLVQDKDRRLLPIVWNRWRQYVGMRKLIKYHLQKANCLLHPSKADLKVAFDRWRRCQDGLRRELEGLNYQELMELGNKTSNQVEQWAKEIEESQAIQEHLLAQRDEFLNFYVKAQILALALFKDRNKFVQFQAESRWYWRVQGMNSRELERGIRDGAFKLANLQDRERELENSNKEMEGENEELRRFTEDGRMIRENMMRLKEERDERARQMSELEDDLREIEQQNERLKKEMSEMEEKQGRFVNSKFQNLAKLKGGEDEGEQERRLQERMNRLMELSQGAGIR